MTVKHIQNNYKSDSELPQNSLNKYTCDNKSRHLFFATHIYIGTQPDVLHQSVQIDCSVAIRLHLEMGWQLFANHCQSDWEEL